ncbi:hypothetical protein PAXRUDRAFT_828214 [Paxillus rubicundulus Ve08.2h10]|uniref:UBX domain-containing protein n=1 Tax=Paxillus rubicundulus Ve08.2h10 TaxID=930991 RepID=A0A0D0DWG6_9AGAM|nr:hypothetical protein PAXRUDRAFT_828214 [Paxillus rubicundulus Ve08.2h10]
MVEPSDFKVYRPPETSRGPPLGELPDSYFAPTPADLKAAQGALTARTQALVNAPLQLRATREALEKAKRDRWPNTTIRIRFSDQTQLEKIFLSSDKIRSVYAFVRSSLRDDVKPTKFVLYQAPPKRDLKVSDPKVKDLTLAELQLAPSSVLLLRFEDETLNRSDAPAPLSSTVAAQATELPKPLTFTSEESVMAAKPESARSSGIKKIPKWFKPGLKK